MRLICKNRQMPTFFTLELSKGGNLWGFHFFCLSLQVSQFKANALKATVAELNANASLASLQCSNASAETNARAHKVFNETLETCKNLTVAKEELLHEMHEEIGDLRMEKMTLEIESYNISAMLQVRTSNLNENLFCPSKAEIKTRMKICLSINSLSTAKRLWTSRGRRGFARSGLPGRRRRRINFHWLFGFLTAATATAGTAPSIPP